VLAEWLTFFRAIGALALGLVANTIPVVVPMGFV
jgi:hypothetical protein